MQNVILTAIGFLLLLPILYFLPLRMSYKGRAVIAAAALFIASIGVSTKEMIPLWQVPILLLLLLFLLSYIFSKRLSSFFDQTVEGHLNDHDNYSHQNNMQDTGIERVPALNAESTLVDEEKMHRSQDGREQGRLEELESVSPLVNDDLELFLNRNEVGDPLDMVDLSTEHPQEFAEEAAEGLLLDIEDIEGESFEWLQDKER